MKVNTPSPAKELAFFGARLGKIFFNMSIPMLLLSVMAVLSVFSAILVLVIALLIVLATLGTIFVIVPDFWQNVVDGTGIASDIANFLFVNGVTFSAVTSVLAALAVILLALDRKQRHPVRITFACIILVVALFCALISAWGNQ